MVERTVNLRRGLAAALPGLLLLAGCASLPGLPGGGSNQGGQGSQPSPATYTDSRYHYRIDAPGPMSAKPNGAAAYAFEDERLEVTVVEGAKAADPAALAEMDAKTLSSSTPDFRLLAAPIAVTIGGQRMIKFIFDSTVTGDKPLKVTTARYYVPKSDALLAVVTYRDASTEFDSSEADSILSTFKWL
jgi:hypothetical protein